MMLLGIDSGGTSCRLALCGGAGRVLSQVTVPGHNPNADGFPALEASFRQGLDALLAPFGGREAAIDALHGGIAGGEGDNRPRLEQMLRSLLPRCARVSVSSDALIALSAGLGAADGGVLIAGTGTIGFVRKKMPSCALAAGAIWPTKGAPAGTSAGTASGPPWRGKMLGYRPPPSPLFTKKSWA